MVKKVVIPYTPRLIQKKLHKLQAQYRYFVAVCHRSMGKSVFCAARLVEASLRDAGTYVYLAPEKSQCEKIVKEWFNLFFQDMPGYQYNKAKNIITLPNKSRIYLEGADKPDRLRGMHLKGIVIDEVADMPADIWEYVIHPALQANEGWAVFIGTPKGKDKFYEFYERGLDETQPRWGTIVIPVTKSGVYSRDEIKLKEKEYSPAAWAQEWLCDFEAEVSGTYYSEILNHLEAEGHIGNYPYNPSLPVYTAWDLGLNDQTAIWFVQIDKHSKAIYIIDFVEDSRKALPYYIQIVNQKPYSYLKAILPHDADRRNFDTGLSRLDVFKKFGLKTKVLPKPADGNTLASQIANVQHMLHRCYFDKNATREGINHLAQYSSKRDRMTGRWLSIPKHDKHSDAADAFRYMCIGVGEELKRQVSQEEYLTNREHVVKYSPLQLHKKRLPKRYKGFSKWPFPRK